MSRKSLVSIPASSAATCLIHWAQLGHFASSVDPKKGAERLFQIKLPNKSTGSCFAAAVLTKLCPIKPDGIYAVPCYIAHLADFRFGYLASTFSVRPPQNPKDLGFRVFSPFALRWCRPFGLKTPASCRTENHDLPAIWPRKNRLTDF